MNSPGLSWIFYALTTVVAWGVYGILLHGGQLGMQDPVHGRYKAFFVCRDCVLSHGCLGASGSAVVWGRILGFPSEGALCGHYSRALSAQ